MRLLIALLLFLLPARLMATTYYVRADGSATKVNAVGPTSDSTKCMSMATHNASTFSAGDVIYLSSLGGDFSTAMAVPSSGSAGNPILYSNASGESPVLANNAQNALACSTKSWVTITGINVNSSSALSYCAGINLDGAGTDVIVSNLWINMPTNGYAISSGSAKTNLVLTGITATNAANEAIYLYGATNSNLTLSNSTFVKCERIYIKNCSGGVTVASVVHTNGVGTDAAFQLENCSGLATITNVLIYTPKKGGLYFLTSDFTNALCTGCLVKSASAHSIWVSSSNGLTLSNNTVTTVIGANSAIYMDGICTNLALAANTVSAGGSHGFDIAGTVTGAAFSSNISSNNSGVGFQISSATGATNITFSSDIADGNSIGWVMGKVGSAFTLQSCISRNNHGDGFSVADLVHDVTLDRCDSHLNGSKTSTSDGDGFTSHETNYNINLDYCLSYSNTCSGYAMTSFSAGRIFNSMAWANAGNWTGVGGLDQVRGGLYFSLSGTNPVSGTTWLVTNCLSGLNYPREVRVNAAPGSSSCPILIDNNGYYPTSSAAFASINDGSTTISWTTYHTTDGYEPLSLNTSPLFFQGTYGLTWISPMINRGLAVGLTKDFAGNPIIGTPDIGAYEYQAKPVLVQSGSQKIPIR